MKPGRSINELAAELQRQYSAREDYITHTSAMRFDLQQYGKHKQPVLELSANESGTYQLDQTSLAERQLASHLGVPARYYEMLRDEHPALLVNSMNTLLQERPSTRMVRAIDGRARAVLSDRYRRIDNFEVMQAVLPVLTSQANGLQVVSCEVTETKCYLKVVFPRVEAEVGKGDVVQSGLVISNSEVGLGTFNIQPLIYRLVCLNGMIAPDRAIRRRHVGRQLEADDGESYRLFSDETRQADDRALLLKIQDLTKAALDTAAFQRVVEAMKATKERAITGNPVKAVEVLAKTFKLTEGETGGIMQHLITGGDISQFGLLNAVTRYSQDVSDYDRATDFEALGGQIMALPAKEWKAIATAE
jgi:hypothetical protein